MPKVRETRAKNILSKSQVYDYALNPYVGCQHACIYCYAKFMKRFTGHREQWGEFVDVKINAPELVALEVKKKTMGRVWISGVCDPYQPLEKKYELTRKCIEILVENGWPFTIQTKSPLVLRDIEILKRSSNAEVGFTITTADEKIRRIFESAAPPSMKRIDALSKLHSERIRTFAMIAPILREAERLIEDLEGKIEYVIVDRLNYHYADWAYKEKGLEWAMKDSFSRRKAEELKTSFAKKRLPCQIVF